MNREEAMQKLIDALDAVPLERLIYIVKYVLVFFDIENQAYRQ